MPLLMASVQRRISGIREQHLKELQLKLFHEWPDDRRGAPKVDTCRGGCAESFCHAGLCDARHCCLIAVRQKRRLAVYLPDLEAQYGAKHLFEHNGA